MTKSASQTIETLRLRPGQHERKQDTAIQGLVPRDLAPCASTIDWLTAKPNPRTSRFKVDALVLYKNHNYGGRKPSMSFN
jgi:hypothetical protein